jgi:hypothetical protein
MPHIFFEEIPLEMRKQALFLTRIFLIAEKDMWVGAEAPTLPDHA